MNDLAFECPVSILVGAGYTLVVDSVHEAHRLLNDWDAQRGPAHRAAVKACQAAFEGQVDGETVRGIFEAFARAHGVLVQHSLAAAKVATLANASG